MAQLLQGPKAIRIVRWQHGRWETQVPGQSQIFNDKWNLIQIRLVDVVLAALKESRGRKKNGKPNRLFSWGEVITLKKAAHTCLAESSRANQFYQYHCKWGYWYEHHDWVFGKYCQVLDEYLNSSVRPALLLASSSSNDEAFLFKYINIWRDYKILVYWLQKFFLVNRTRKTTAKKMVKYADEAFAVNVTYSGVESRLIFVTAKITTWKLAGKPCRIGDEGVKDAVIILESSQEALHFLNNRPLKSSARFPNLVVDFTHELKTAACSFYEGLWQASCKEGEPSAILSTIEDSASKLKLVEQKCGLQYFIHSRTNLYQLHRKKMVLRAKGIFFVGDNAAFTSFLVENSVADIARTYRLYENSSTEAMVAMFYGFLWAEGRNNVSQKNLLNFYSRCMYLLEKAFQSNKQFLRAFHSYYLVRTLNVDCAKIIDSFYGFRYHFYRCDKGWVMACVEEDSPRERLMRERAFAEIMTTESL